MRFLLRSAVALGMLFALASCGETSGSVLELVPDTAPDAGNREPPGSEPRIDVFVVRDVDACAVGEPCRADEPDAQHNGECFEIEEGDRTVGFRTETLRFLAPEDPDVSSYDNVSCFHLIIDDEEMAVIERDFSERFINTLFGLSDGEIFASVKVHEIPLIRGGLVRYETESGIFLPPDSLDSAPSLASRDTDFTYAVTGERDPFTGAEPRNEHCAGTVQEIWNGLAGAGYTWLSTECNREDALLRAFLYQVAVFLPDVNDFNDYYRDGADNDHTYPDCHDPTPSPTEWWPSPNDCNDDPDSPTCGDQNCDDDDREFARHVLTEHWPRRSPYVGNHCANGREDRHLNEYGIDTGGVCDDLGRPQQTSQRPVMR